MDAKPPGEVRWFWNGDEVSGRITTISHNNGTYDVSNWLEIPATPATDGAEFICLATNEVKMAAGEEDIRLIATLSIYCKLCNHFVLNKCVIHVKGCRLYVWLLYIHVIDPDKLGDKIITDNNQIE